MKRNKNILLLLAVTVIAGLLSGCQVTVDTAFNEDGSGTVTQMILMEHTDLNNTGENSDYTWDTVTINGILYDRGTATKNFLSPDELKNSNSLGSDVHFDSSYFLIKNENIGYADVSGSISANYQVTYTFTFPYEVLKSNGTIQKDNKTVVWTYTIDDDSEMLWAVFSDKLLNTGIAAPKLTKKDKTKTEKDGYTITSSSPVVYATSDTLIASMTVNGKKMSSDNITFYSEGKYKVVCTDVNGKSSSLTFTIDKTAPTVKGIKDGKTYTSARTIKFSDKYGIKSAKLNGKTIKSGKKVSKKGTYKLIVKDKSGNKTVVKFKIK